MKKFVSGALCVGILSLGLATFANATLLSRLGGLAVYDTDLNITWLADANAGAGSAFDDGFSTTDGAMSWDNANAWAASLNIGGATGWRLPTADASCNSGGFGTFNCTNSEVGHLYYDELNGTIFDLNDPNRAMFSNVQFNYWTGTEVTSNEAIEFVFTTGAQVVLSKSFSLNAWAVHDGDIGGVSVVSEPHSLALLGLGVAGLFGLNYRKQQQFSV